MDALTTAFPFSALHEVNERCIELLVNAARSGEPAPFAIVTALRDELRTSGPAIRRKAAHRGFLLVDMEFANKDWWTAMKHEPERRLRAPNGQGSFPRRTALPLARATLMSVWQGIRVDPDAACVVLGLFRPVAEVIGAMQLTELDAIADRHFHRLAPRWTDRPAIWRKLLLAAASDKASVAREFDLHALQAMLGDVIRAQTF